MIVPVFAVFILGSVGGLMAGLYYRNVIVLFALNSLWWVGSFISAYFVWLAWLDRGYSENWAMIGFMIFSLPYGLLTLMMLFAELFFIRKWHGNNLKPLRLVSILLLTFLMVQLIAGFSSG
jgi:hypothetical protein